MLTRMCGAMLTAALSVLLSGCSARVQYITEEQAKDAVRAFESNPNLQFVSVELVTDDDPYWQDYTRYELLGPEHGGNYGVHATTGEVRSATYSDAWPPDRPEDPVGPLTQAQCQDIALAYARAKYADFDAMSFQLQTPAWKGYGWDFTWLQKLAYDAWTMNRVLVSINPATGDVQDYGSDRVAVTAPRQPVLTAQQALDIAKDLVGMTVESEEDRQGPVLMVDPQGNVYCGTAIAGTDAQGYSTGTVALVNAETGAVFRHWDDVESRGTHEPARGLGSIPVRQLVRAIPKAAVHWLGEKGARLIVGRRSFRLRPGSDVLASGGEKFRLSGKAQLVKGWLMAPPDLVEVVRKACAARPGPG